MTKKVEKRADLLKVEARKEFLKDENRKAAVDKRHAKGYLTARENINNLCDTDSFLEYGSAIFAAQRTRFSNEYLIENTPADGLVTGVGDINGEYFKDSETKCAVLSYDFTVLAGTQGYMNHKKTERVFKIAKNSLLPIIFFLEGGGGRPGDVDVMQMVVGGLNLDTFAMYGKLSGKVPRIAIVNGYSFAGNAALAGSSDIIIATKSASIGMAGPAMIEGGGLGKFHPKEVGPMSVQVPNGVVDILVENEKDAVEVAKQYLYYFQ
jgi:acetyl-CoA carboxylase carboxyltransferase component